MYVRSQQKHSTRLRVTSALQYLFICRYHKFRTDPSVHLCYTIVAYQSVPPRVVYDVTRDVLFIRFSHAVMPAVELTLQQLFICYDHKFLPDHAVQIKPTQALTVRCLLERQLRMETCSTTQRHTNRNYMYDIVCTIMFIRFHMTVILLQQ